MTEAYPLAWPPGWPRTPPHKLDDSRYRFARSGVGGNSGRSIWTFAAARDALLDEVQRLGGRSPVLSTNFQTDRNGMPTDRGRRPPDEGVAIYFTRNFKQTVMACDMHMRAEENMRSLALSIEAMRALARHGGGTMMDRAFDGFAALPAPGKIAWWHILGVPQSAGKGDIEAAFKAKAKTAHPDAGGSNALMAELTRARCEALEGR